MAHENQIAQLQELASLLEVNVNPIVERHEKAKTTIQVSNLFGLQNQTSYIFSR